MPTRGPVVIDLTEPSPPRPQRPETDALLDAINTAPDKRVRLALRVVCNVSEAASKIVQEMLLVPTERVRSKAVEKDVDSEGDVDEDDESNEEEDDDDDEETSEDESDVGGENKNSVSAPNLKRLRPRFARCKNCKEDFDVETNDRDSCCWHPGDKEPYYDEDFWADDDEACHGSIDRYRDVAAFSKGFKYDCCDEYGDSGGCKTGKHIDKGNVYKKMRR